MKVNRHEFGHFDTINFIVVHYFAFSFAENAPSEANMHMLVHKSLNYPDKGFSVSIVSSISVKGIPAASFWFLSITSILWRKISLLIQLAQGRNGSWRIFNNPELLILFGPFVAQRREKIGSN